LRTTIARGAFNNKRQQAQCMALKLLILSNTKGKLAARNIAETQRLDMQSFNWHDHEMQSISGPFLPLAGLLFLASAGLMTAQTGAPHRTVWDGVYTEAQATRGTTTAFGQSCAGCHALAATGRAPLAGDSFWKSFALKTVGDLREYVSTYMPNGTPGTLNESTYNDIVALMLKTNGFPAGNTELQRDTIADVQILQKDGSTELPANSLARVVGCLTKSATDWVVTSATNPERAERAGGDDATRPLGSRSMPLKFVLTRLDPLAGSRIAVSGLLIGANGADGINVTTVNRVAPKCP
jgi:mono/diheme cytochrome c family protein